jgi:hypothetical protein
MYARIVTFHLDGPSSDQYHAHAVAIAESFNDWPGLRAKVWLADEADGRFGGFYLFDSAADADQSRSAPEFLSLQKLPVFTDLTIEEFEILDEPTAITGGGLAPSRVAA